ncbi:MAG: hypothetical protein DRQ35_06180, partial [Gammaproteobacteria bacterium]
LMNFFYDEFYNSEIESNEYSIGSCLSEKNINHMSELAHEFSLMMPYDYFGGGFNTVSAEELQNHLEVIGIDSLVSSDYHSTDRDDRHWIIEEDPSIESDGDGFGMEVISPPMQYQQGIQQIEQVFTILQNDMNAITNESTGLHINVSIEGIDFNDIDYVKLVLLLGDDYISRKFNRFGNQYALSTIEQIERSLGDNRLEQQYTSMPEILSTMRSKVNKVLQQAFSNNIDFGKYTTVGIKGNYIEFRAAGNSGYLNNFETIKNTINRFVSVYAISANENSHQEEYAKKLFKLTQGLDKYSSPYAKDAMTLFSAYNAGKIDKSTLKSYLKNRNLNRQAQQDKDEEDAKGIKPSLTDQEFSIYATALVNQLGITEEAAHKLLANGATTEQKKANAARMVKKHMKQAFRNIKQNIDYYEVPW